MSYQQKSGVDPLLILSEDSKRTQGRDAQTANIQAAKAVAEAVRTALGPHGMDKMLVDEDGNVVVSNNGATILQEMDIDHPAAQIIAEVATSQYKTGGDGTTTATLLAGELLRQAEDLLEQDTHPTTIADGYYEAAEKTKDIIEDIAASQKISDEQLQAIAATALAGINTDSTLHQAMVRAIRCVQAEEAVNTDNIRIQTLAEVPSDASQLFEGVVLETPPAHPQMVSRFTESQIAIFSCDLLPRESELGAVFDVTDTGQLADAYDFESQELARCIQAISNEGVDIVITTGDIDDKVVNSLARDGRLAFENVATADARAVAKATGATITTLSKTIDASDLGTARSLYRRQHGDQTLTYIEGGQTAESVTLFIQAQSEHVATEIKRALEDTLTTLAVAVDDGTVVPGGGATEIAIATQLRDFALSVSGRKQLAITAFADAIEAVPRTLAENAGLDPVNALVRLREANEIEDQPTGLSTIQVSTQSAHTAAPKQFVSRLERSEPEALTTDDIERLWEVARGTDDNLRNRSLAVLGQWYLQQDTLSPKNILGIYEIQALLENESYDWVADLDARLDTAFAHLNFPEPIESEIIKSLPETVDIRQVRSRFVEREGWLQNDRASADGGTSSQELYLYSLRNRVTSGDQQSVAKENSSAQTDINLVYPVEKGIIEPAVLKQQAINSATEAAMMILKIDDIISASDLVTHHY